MEFPPFWARGSSGSFACWRLSFTSFEEARDAAAAAAQALAARFRAGQLPPRHGGYYPGRPFREPVLLELRDDSGEVSAVVTRNSFGCAVLNAARALFAGVDLPRPKPPGLFARLLGKPAPPPALTQDAVLARAEEWALRHPGWGWRVYRTPAGLRLLATHALFKPSSPVVEEVFEALGADPLYRRLCRAQKCFRARLTPKPWRCGMPGRPPRWPWQNPEEERQFQEWEARYRARAAEWAACNFLHTIGNPAVHPAIAQILRVHDEAARADSGLETA